MLGRTQEVSLVEYGRRHVEPHRAIKELEESVLICCSREVAAIARVYLLRQLASAGNSSGLDVAPSYSQGRDETSRTRPNAPLELAQPDFACRASDETKKLESTFGLHGEMDEFRRLKVMYPTASLENLPTNRFLPRRWQRVGKMAVAAKTVVKIIVKTPVTTASGAGTASKDFKDPRERHLRGRPFAGPRWGETSNSSCTSLYPSGRDRRRRSRRCRKEKTQDRSAEFASRASYSTSSDSK